MHTCTPGTRICIYTPIYTTSMFAFQSGGTWEPGNEANHAYIIIVACFLDNAIYNNCSLRLCVSVKEVLQLYKYFWYPIQSCMSFMEQDSQLIQFGLICKPTPFTFHLRSRYYMEAERVLPVCWMQTEGKNREGLERRLCTSSMKSSSLVPRLPCSRMQTLKLCRLPTGSYLFSGSGKPGNKIYKQLI